MARIVNLCFPILTIPYSLLLKKDFFLFFLMMWLDLGDLQIFCHANRYMCVSLIDLNCTCFVPLCLAKYVLNFLLLSVAMVLFIHKCDCVS